MNVQKELEDILEILEYRRKISMKLSSKVGEYRYGQVKSYNEAIELLKDLKRRWIEHEELVASKEDIAKKMQFPLKRNEDLLQVV
jgi:hypothetical protein